MDIEWEGLVKLIALLLVLEGILLVLMPSMFHRLLVSLKKLGDRALQIMGSFTLVAGLLIFGLTR